MASRTKGGMLSVIILVGALVVFVGPVRDKIGELFGGGNSEIIGTGDNRLMVSSGDKSRVEGCTPERVIIDKSCGDLKVVIVNAAKMPFIARNISLAWVSGKPAELTRDSRENRRAKYAATCGPGIFTIKYPGAGSCDEYPFASTQEGGAGARTEEVPIREQDCQGGTLSTAYRYQNITTGTTFLVVISNPDQVASGPFTGTDSAEDQSACGS